MSNIAKGCGFDRLYGRSPVAGSAGTSIPKASWKNARERSMFSTNAVKVPVPRTEALDGVWPIAIAHPNAATRTTARITREIDRARKEFGSDAQRPPESGGQRAPTGVARGEVPPSNPTKMWVGNHHPGRYA